MKRAIVPFEKAGKTALSVVLAFSLIPVAPSLTESAAYAQEVAESAGPNATFEVSMASASFVYDGRPHSLQTPPTSTATTGQTTYQYSVDKEDWSNDFKGFTLERAGEKTIYVRAQNAAYPDYYAYTQAILTVQQKEVVVQPRNQYLVYGNRAKAPSAVVSGVLPSESVADMIRFRLSTEGRSFRHAGQYRITSSGAESQGNYHVVFNEGTLTVAKRKVTISTSGNYSKVYGEADPVITWVAEDAESGAVKLKWEPNTGKARGTYYSDVKVALGYEGQDKGAVGEHAIVASQTLAADNPDYDITLPPGAKVTVYAKSLADANVTKVAPDKQEYKGWQLTPDVQMTYTMPSTQQTVTLVKDVDYKLTYANNTNAGTASVTVTGIGNYTGSATLSFEITKKHPRTPEASEFTIIPRAGGLVDVSGFKGTMEYSRNGTNWFTATDSQVSGLEPGKLYIRYAETENQYAGEACILTIPKYYKVTFDMGGHGSPVPDQFVAEGEKVKNPGDPTDSAYVFYGWYANADFLGARWSFESIPVTSDMTLHARWAARGLDASKASAISVLELTKSAVEARIMASGRLRSSQKFIKIRHVELAADRARARIQNAENERAVERELRDGLRRVLTSAIL